MGSLYNTLPDHYREIDEHEFARAFFGYVKKEAESRQFCYPAEEVAKIPVGLRHATLFEFWYQGWEGMGVAMAHDFWNKKIHYYKFGAEERWKKNEAKFAAQFAGDNS